LFAKALELQQRIEGPAGGAMRERILLNEGLSAIDRGRLSTAQKSFAEILRTSPKGTLEASLATGFLGIVDHVTGKVTSARSRYESAIEELAESGGLRPLGILKQHLGDLHRHLEQFDKARACYLEAIQVAEAGGYTDQVHYARISEITADVREGRYSRVLETAAPYLQEAEEYADRMDIPRLKVDVLLIRGEIQIRQGETSLASQLITRGLRIANLHGLILRRIYALRLLSHVYRARGNTIVAERLRFYALRAARDTGYHLSVPDLNRPTTTASERDALP
jgi:tetratricopeptide (TPR) repeat protein